jgi:threonine/homoserine/homoserine lactone efflux protein
VIASDGWSTAQTLITTAGGVALAWIAFKQAKLQKRQNEVNGRLARKIDDLGTQVGETQTQIDNLSHKESQQ